MLNASQIIKLIPDGGSITFSFAVTKDGNMSVLFKPQYPATNKTLSHDVKEAIDKVTTPRLITGTPEELDNSFLELVEKAVESIKCINTVIEDTEKAAKEAIEKIKAEGTKKIEDAIKEAKKKEKAKEKEEKEKSFKPNETTEPSKDNSPDGEDKKAEVNSNTENAAVPSPIETNQSQLF